MDVRKLEFSLHHPSRLKVLWKRFATKKFRDTILISSRCQKRYPLYHGPPRPHHNPRRPAPRHQRGNRRRPIFFSDADRILYLDLVREGCAAARVTCLAWCLMDNHVHLILVPETADGLRAAQAHRRYTRHVNAREDWTGFLFQGRFASYPMDDAHLMAAVRYVELNPVAAGMVAHAQDWRWSSARSHVAGRRMAGDPLTNVAALATHVSNWHAMLRHGLEASHLGPESEAAAAAIETRLRTGRPLATEEWIARHEAALDRKLSPAKRGRKPKAPDAAK